ncbi:MAG: hypothetical protein M3Y21_01970 [Candidatus Eremiobacteraeota bacterium]|nr:hypothetical protein [Candidatus Eremiobacteraeota bacterium]
MAIRPVDLQLAYIAAPQNAAIAANAQDAPQIAARAAQASFAAEFAKREETVAETTQVEGNKVRARGDRESGEQAQAEYEDQHPREPDSDRAALGLSGEGAHFIDVTA